MTSRISRRMKQINHNRRQRVMPLNYYISWKRDGVKLMSKFFGFVAPSWIVSQLNKQRVAPTNGKLKMYAAQVNTIRDCSSGIANQKKLAQEWKSQRSSFPPPLSRSKAMQSSAQHGLKE